MRKHLITGAITIGIVVFWVSVALLPEVVLPAFVLGATYTIVYMTVAI